MPKKTLEPVNDNVEIYIPTRQGFEYRTKTIKGKKKNFLYGSVGSSNGPSREFEVPMDELVEVHPDVAEVLRPYWDLN